MKELFEKYQKAKYATRVMKVTGVRRLYFGLIAAVCARRIAKKYIRKFRDSLPDSLDPNAGFVVSLTSFPGRIDKVWIVVDSMMRQYRRPAEICLNLYEGEFPDGINNLPSSLTPYLDLGLKIQFVPENLMPHLKYFYTFKEESNSQQRPVITVDDDLFYAPDTLERLINLNARFPDAVAGNICKLINESGYDTWESVVFPSEPSNDLIALGFGAVLYPASFYCTCHYVYDVDKLKSLSLRADDLWLKHCEILHGTKVVCGNYFAVPPEIEGTQKTALSHSNVRAKMNDIQWKRLSQV